MSARASRSLSPKQRARADALFDELLELPRERRGRIMSGWQLEDPVVVEEVASLLRAAEAFGASRLLITPETVVVPLWTQIVKPASWSRVLIPLSDLTMKP